MQKPAILQQGTPIVLIFRQILIIIEEKIWKIFFFNDKIATFAVRFQKKTKFFITNYKPSNNNEKGRFSSVDFRKDWSSQS
jgi:hypothetical protein